MVLITRGQYFGIFWLSVSGRNGYPAINDLKLKYKAIRLRSFFLIQVNPGQFENLAKMTRIPVQSLSQTSNPVHTAVKLRNIHPPSGIQTGSQKQSTYIESDTDQTETPRPQSYRSYDKTQQTRDNSRLLFYRVGIKMGKVGMQN